MLLELLSFTAQPSVSTYYVSNPGDKMQGPFMSWPAQPGTICHPWVTLSSFLNAFCSFCIGEDTVLRIIGPKTHVSCHSPSEDASMVFYSLLGEIWIPQRGTEKLSTIWTSPRVYCSPVSSPPAPRCPHTSQHKCKLHPQHEGLLREGPRDPSRTGSRAEWQAE